MATTIEIKRSEDDYGLRILRATQEDNGDVRIEGQDLGTGLESIFGPGIREYEYIMTVRAKDVLLLARALGGAETGILDALRNQFQAPDSMDPRSFLEAQGIPHDFWNRMGD